MLEKLLSFWRGKLFVLFLLGFVATAWLFTITLSASSASEQVVGNPLVPDLLRDREVIITLVLVAILGGVFLKGFREAIGIAIFIVGAYMLLNFVIVAVGFYQIATNPGTLTDWTSSLLSNYGSPVAMIAISVLVFPQLALGLSGFETGVSVMPLVRGEADDDPQCPAERRQRKESAKMATLGASAGKGRAFSAAIEGAVRSALEAAGRFVPALRYSGAEFFSTRLRAMVESSCTFGPTGGRNGIN